MFGFGGKRKKYNATVHDLLNNKLRIETDNRINPNVSGILLYKNLVAKGWWDKASAEDTALYIAMMYYVGMVKSDSGNDRKEADALMPRIQSLIAQSLSDGNISQQRADQLSSVLEKYNREYGNPAPAKPAQETTRDNVSTSQTQVRSALSRGDYTTAFRLLQPLAEQGDAPAQSALGSMFSIGQGVPQDYAEAVKWFRKAAAQGDASAQCSLGFMYSNGLSVPADNAEALKWFRKAAEQGDATAQFNVGDVYSNGLSVPADNAEALKWYRKAAAQGFTPAQAELGVMYHYGHGVPQDYAEAVKWFRKAAAQGDGAAQEGLGKMYELGHGVPQDYAEAVKWFRKAAEQGNSKAQYGLGYMYSLGQGVRKDIVQAGKWLILAAERASDHMEKYAAVTQLRISEMTMTHEQIGAAQKLAQEWKPTRSTPGQ